MYQVAAEGSLSNGNEFIHENVQVDTTPAVGCPQDGSDHDELPCCCDEGGQLREEGEYEETDKHHMRATEPISKETKWDAKDSPTKKERCITESIHRGFVAYQVVLKDTFRQEHLSSLG